MNRLQNSFRLTRLDLSVLGISALLAAVIGLVTVVGTADAVGLRVAFMKNGENGITNLWVADATNPDNAEQVTDAEDGVYDYDVSPDGRYIAFAEQDFETGIAEIMRLDLNTRQVTPLTDCRAQDADCTTPVWRPDGRMIAYTWRDLNTSLQIGASPNRIWVLDFSTSPASNYPLVEDTQVLGYDPKWSPDGTRLAFYDSASGGILVYNFAADQDAGENPFTFVPTSHGTVGTFSPDGTQLIFPELLLTGTPIVRAYLQVADLETGLFQQLTAPSESTDDQAAVWSPSGGMIAVTRRYVDNRMTRGHQIFLFSTADNSIEPLVYDERYNQGFALWSPNGDQLLLQRFPVLTEDGQDNPNGTPEIWTFDVATRALTLIMRDAYQPRWVPAQQ
ncbi:MAG: hypothetical protein SF029_08930 [bacterium]|nr:hypothetical protein [bacterium]